MNSVRAIKRHVVSNYRIIECLFNNMFRLATKKHKQSALLSLCAGNPPVTDGFPAQRVMFPFDDVIMKTDADSIVRYGRRDFWKIQHIEAEGNGRHLADDIFKYIFLNENIWILNEISLKFVSNGPIDNMPTLVKIKAWRLLDAKSLHESMMT